MWLLTVSLGLHTDDLALVTWRSGIFQWTSNKWRERGFSFPPKGWVSSPNCYSSSWLSLHSEQPSHSRSLLIPFEHLWDTFLYFSALQLLSASCQTASYLLQASSTSLSHRLSHSHASKLVIPALRDVQSLQLLKALQPSEMLLSAEVWTHLSYIVCQNLTFKSQC